MVIIFITAWLAIVAVCGLYYRQPWRARARLGVLWIVTATYRPRHGQPAADADQQLADWAGDIVGVDVCARCAAPMQGGACPRCRWERPPERAPWPRLTDADRAAMAAGLDTARAIAAEPRPGAVLMPAPTDDISGAGRPAEPAPGAWRAAYADLAPPAPPAPPYALPWAVQPTDPPPLIEFDGPSGPLAPNRLGAPIWAGPSPGIVAWLERDDPAEDDGPEPPPPEPELPPEGPGLHLAGCDGGHPEGARCNLDGDDGPDQDGPGGGPWAPHGYARGAMRWAPSRRATPADAEHAADLGRQDADAAEFIDAMAADARRYLWQVRRGFLAQRGLAF